MGKIKLGKYIEEYSQKNRTRKPYPVYSVTNSNGFCTEYFTKDVSSEDKSGYKLVPYGYFAYNPSRINVGSVDCQTKEETVIVSPLYTVFKVSEGLDIEYLRYFFKSNYCKYLIKSKVSGSVRFNLKFDTLKTFEINEIGPEEQKKAVDLFISIEDLIKTEEKELALCDELIKSRFIELFDGKFPAESLYSVCEELFAGGDVKKDDLSEEKDDEHPYPIFTNGEANDGLYGYTSKARVFKEAVTVSGRGTIGYTSLRSEPFYPAVRLIVAVPNQKLIDACYLKYFIQSKNYGGSGSSIPQLTVPMIKNELIPVPPMEKQLEFKTFIHEIDKLKFNVQKRIEKYKELLNKKMDEYFN